MIAAAATSGLGRPNTFEIDLAAIASNVHAIRGAAGKAWLCPALKADAYGFGLLPVARTVLEAGADAVAVGDVDAGVRIRQAGIRAPVLVYAGSLLSAHAAAACRDHDLIATVHDAASLSACLNRGGGRLDLFLEVDSGLQRLGLAPADLPAAVAKLVADPGVRLTGVYTHLHVPEAPDEAARLVPLQFKRFLEAAAALPATALRMAASSRVLARFPEMALDAVDPGRAVFGLPWLGDTEFQATLRPAFAGLRTRLLQVMPAGAGPHAEPGRALGVVPLGRRDGLPLLSAGQVMVRGRRVRLVGPPSLEHSRLDLSDVPEAVPGDEVVVIGRQGQQQITLADVLAAQPELAATAMGLQVGSGVARRYVD